MGKECEACASFDRATQVACEAWAESHRMQGIYHDLSKSFALGEEEMMLLRADIRALKDPTE